MTAKAQSIPMSSSRSHIDYEALKAKRDLLQEMDKRILAMIHAREHLAEELQSDIALGLKLDPNAPQLKRITQGVYRNYAEKIGMNMDDAAAIIAVLTRDR